MEDITDADYMHAKRVCKDFEIKNLGEYHDLYLKSDTFAALKRIEVKLELSANINMLLMVEKGIRGKIYHVIHQYAKSKNKYMKDYER